MNRLLITMFCLSCIVSVQAQTAVKVSAGTYVVNNGAACNISGSHAPGGIPDSFVNGGFYIDTVAGGQLNAGDAYYFAGGGTTYLWDLNINGGLSAMAATVNVWHTATINAGDSMAANGFLVLHSGANLVNNGALTGTVGGLVTTASVTTGGCPSYTSSLSLNISGTQMAYQWQSSPNNVAWTNVSGATNAAYTPTVTASVYYRCNLSTLNTAYSQATGSVLLSLTGALPTVAAITGSASVSTGANITLTDATVGGAWSASNGNATVTGGIVHGVTAGTVTISYSVTNICGTTAATKLVTVGTSTTTATVAAITGYQFYLCSGATAPFFDATAGGAWSISAADAAVASVSATGVVTGISAGTARLSYTVGASSATAVVTVYALPAAITGTANVCQGLTTALTTATPGGVWSSAIPATATVGSTGIVSATNVGTVPIYYTIAATTCKATLIVTVTANPGAITGPVKVCTGATISLSDATIGGVWSGSNAYGTVDPTGNVSGIAAGAVVVSYTTGLSCRKTVTVSVNAAPAAISGTLTVCTGKVTFLSDATTPATSWTSSTPAVATITASGAVTGVATGTTTVTYTLANGCTTTAVVTVNPTPAVTAISGASSVSRGGAGITLSDATAGGLWSSSNTARLLVGSTTGLVTALVSAGTATISYTVISVAGCSNFATKVISTSPAPREHGGTIVTTVGEVTNLATEVAAGEWTSSDNTIATVDGNGVVSAVAAGSVHITHTTANSDGETIATTTEVLVNALAMQVSLLPNPNHGTFAVKGTQGTSADAAITMEITNMLGQVVYSAAGTATGGVINETIKLNNNLANGMYILNVRCGSKSTALHFVMEK